MTTKLLGVRHAERFAESIIRQLKELKIGQTVALEISPEELRLFEEVYRAGGDVRKKLYKCGAEQFEKAFKLAEREAGKRIGYAPEQWSFKEYVDGAMFFYKIFEHIKKEGYKCIPIVSDIIRSETWRSVAKFHVTTDKKSLSEIIKTEILTLPVKEQSLIKKIIKTKPSYAIIGAVHLNETHALLGKLGYPSEIVFRQKSKIMEKPVHAIYSSWSGFIRSLYRKQKAEKIWARQKKFARRR